MTSENTKKLNIKRHPCKGKIGCCGMCRRVVIKPAKKQKQVA